MRMVRAIALGVAMLIAMPYVAVPPDASAQVWKPKSRQKKQPKIEGTTEAKSPAAKTRKPGKTKSVKRSPKKKAAPAKKKKAKAKKPKPVVEDDDEFFIIEEDFPDED